MTNRTAILALLTALAAASASAQVLDLTGPQPVVPGQTGTSQVQRRLDVLGNPLLTKRVGVVAYCADMAPNAGDFGIFGRQEFAEGITRVQAGIDAGGAPDLGRLATRFNPILDASTIGYFGAQNLVDMLNYDDGIPRFRDVQLIDGDREQPTAQQLIQNFDCVIAYTDNKCGSPIPTSIANQAANALATFAQAPGKGVVLTGMAFNTSTGFGSAIFGGGLSPFRKNSAQLDTRCDPVRGACPIGTCPAGSTRQFPSTVSAPECFSCPAIDPNDPGGTQTCSNVADLAHPPLQLCRNDVTGAECGQFANPIFQPLTATNDRVCESLLQGVFGPTSSSFASQMTAASLSPGATMCATYDGPAAGLPLLAVNANRNVVGLNVFPAYSADLSKTWFSCILANAAILACGERRCIPDPGNPGGSICN